MKRVHAPVPVDARLLRAWPLPAPDAIRSKEDRGRVLVVAGSPDVPGAALLAGEAALRAGAGKLQIGTPASVAAGLALAVPEAKVTPLSTTRSGGCRSSPALEQACAGADAVLIGAGMDDTPTLRNLVARLSRHATGVVVADAGAIAAFQHVHGFRSAPVITPHAGEMASLLDTPIEDVHARPAELARDFAARARVIVVLKAPETLIAAPDGRLWRHTGGGPGLGTSGSGDVLAGIITGLAARGASAEQAAVWGVYLHARAGEALTRAQGSLGFLARELPAQVPRLLEALGPSPSKAARNGKPRRTRAGAAA